MAMEKYGVADRQALQKAELARIDAELDRRDRARGDIIDFEKTAENIRAIEQLRDRRSALLKALADQ
jgi:hypothetical protein